MAKTRTSVELHADGCRLVDVDVSAKDVRVSTFISSIPKAQDPLALAETLGRLRQERKLSRDIWVTAWGMRTVHQLLRLPPAHLDTLEPIARREARKDLAALEASGGPVSVAVVPGAEVQIGSHRKREVALLAVSISEIQQRIQPFVDAGFVVRGIITPALALASLARSAAAKGLGIGGSGTVAYVAIVGQATCLAIVRNGVLLFARELAFGHADPAIESKLSSELKRSIMFFKQTFRAPVEAVVLCGDMPNLRSLTAPLGEALGVAVQVLDSLVGIDAAAVPQPAEEFRAEVASLRMAIAAGADPAPSANLLPKTILESREARQQIVRFAVAAAAGILIVAGWVTVARQTVGSQRAEREAIQRELAILEPDAVRQSQLRQAYQLTGSRLAALAAFDTQGPRLARFLETLAGSTPEEVVLTAVELQPEGAAWNATVRGVATSADASAAQGAVNTLVDGLSGSPFAGAPVQPPQRRVVTGRGGATAGVLPTGTAGTTVPPGMTGVEFSMQIRVPK